MRIIAVALKSIIGGSIMYIVFLITVTVGLITTVAYYFAVSGIASVVLINRYPTLTPMAFFL